MFSTLTNSISVKSRTPKNYVGVSPFEFEERLVLKDTRRIVLCYYVNRNYQFTIIVLISCLPNLYKIYDNETCNFQ